MGSTEHPFVGSIAALPTPFAGGTLDEDGLDALIRFHAQGGTSAIVLGGSAGEGWSLDGREYGLLLDRAVELAAHHSRFKLHVLASVIASDTRAAARQARRAARAGVDGLLLGAPPMVRPSREGLIQHVRTIARDLPPRLPLALHNEPLRTGSDLDLGLIMGILQEVPAIVAHVEGMGRPDRARLLPDRLPIDVLAGDDRMIGPFMRCGAVGAVTVAANLVPRDVERLVRALAENLPEADRWERCLASIVDTLRIGPHPVPIKAALAALGAIEATVRLPLAQLGLAETAALERALVDARLLVPSA